MSTSPFVGDADFLDRLLAPDFDAGRVTAERASELTGWLPAAIDDLMHGDPPLVRVTLVDGREEIDLADLVAVTFAASACPPGYAEPAEGEEVAE